VIALTAILVFAAASIVASRSHWTRLGPEDYQLIARVDKTPIVFNALQDKDRSKIAEIRTENPGIDERWRGTRPDVAPPLEVKMVLPHNGLTDVATGSFDVAFEDEEGRQARKVTKFTVGEKALLMTEPEFSCFELIPSNDYSKYIIPTGKGLWLVDPEKETTRKITDDSYNGKSFDELRGYGVATNKEEAWSLFWNADLQLSPDGSKIVYVTNRDCLDKGTSLWLLDVSTGDEHALIKNEDGEHYKTIGWIDNEHILYGKAVNGSFSGLIADISGNHTEVDIPPFGVLAQHPSGMIAYTPNYEAAKDITIVKIGADEHLTQVHKVDRSHLSYGSVSFSPDGSKLVYAYALDSESPGLTVAVVDLVNKREFNLKNTPAGGIILFDVKWLDNERLLIHAHETPNDMHKVSTWIYSLKGDEVK
jgi:dipeptidyl aminopeptidase/acylaminoacyl peptidase